MRKLSAVFVSTFSAALLAALQARSDDWPTYRHDYRRSAVSAETLAFPLSPAWVFVPASPPAHAWGDPSPTPIEGNLELPKLRFDDAFHVAAAGDLVFFGSSSDHKVYALHAGTGKVAWEFFTEGPVRTAPSVSGGKVYAGSDDGRVYCLDAATGKQVWSFRAAPGPERVLGNGQMVSLWPVRTGVAVDRGVAYFGAGVFPSEGLYLHAVDAATGKPAWKNGYCGRGGAGTVSPQGHILASDDKLFLPSGRTMPAAFRRADGKYLFHVNPDWRQVGLYGGTQNFLHGTNLLVGGTEQIVCMRQTDGAVAFSERLPSIMPTTGTRQVAMDGDAMYAATGRELMAMNLPAWQGEQQRRNLIGGARQQILTAQAQVRWNDEAIATLEKMRGADGASPEEKAAAGSNLVAAVAHRVELRAALATAETKLSDAEKIACTSLVWRAACDCSDSIAVTPDAVFVGGNGVVRAFGRAAGAAAWSAKVSGRARGLAVAGGRLLVSTDTGAIHCFAAGAAGGGTTVGPRQAADPFPAGADTDYWRATAREIAGDSGAKRGYALVVGGGGGRLARELAAATELVVYAADPDGARAAEARKALDAAGLYGTRAAALAVDPRQPVLPDYFANVIVWDTSDPGAPSLPPGADLLRMLKPCGGVAYVGWPPRIAAPGRQRQPDQVREWAAELGRRLAETGEKGTRVSSDGAWARVARGPLPGAGSWTHQYGDAGNTACSGDELVKGPIGVLWYGLPGPARMPSRHAAAEAPLAFGGRMFVQGLDVIMAYDAYNGTELWVRDIPGAMRVYVQGGAPGNLAGGGDSIFAAVENRCLRLDAATGRTTATYAMPVGPEGGVTGRWDCVIWSGGVLYGTRSEQRKTLDNPDSHLFALDAESGRTLWVRAGAGITPGSVAVGDGRVFYADRGATPEQVQEAMRGVEHAVKTNALAKAVPPDVRIARCLDGATGRTEWERPMYVSDCLDDKSGDLTAMYARGVYLLCGQPWNGHFWPEFLAGRFSRRSLIALAGDTGRTLWSGNKGYRSRPLIVGDRVIVEPWACSLKTGEDATRFDQLSGAVSRWQMSRPGHHCGSITASAHGLYGRSGTIAYYDLLADQGIAHFGGQRPVCWMNSIAANGVLLVPEASSGCQCAYSLQCTVAYHAVSRNRAWGVYSAPADGSPAKRVALVFGAPGDRRDSSGNLWLGYPRPYAGRLVAAAGVQTPVATNAPAGAEAPEFVQGDPGFADIAGTADPWIYACGWSGVTNFSVQIHDDPAAWTLCDVRLHFAETEGRAAGGRVFDVALEGRQVLKGFDPAAEAGGPGRAVVREFRDVRVLGWLDVSLAPVRGRPLVSAVEIQRRWVIPSVADSEAVAAESRTGAIELPAAFADGAPMAVGAAIVAGPGHGKLKRVSGRKYDYAPDPRFAGTDRFSWKAVDGTNESRVVAVAVNVKPDVEPPSVTADVFGGAVGRDELTLRFSEPVDPVTAADPANYSISGGATVRGAALRRDGVTVRLATSALAEGQAYEVSVTGVKDTAATPNAAAGARAQVRYSVAGSILREVWLGVTGPGMNGLRSHPDYPDKPSLVEKVSCFEGPQNWADAYGTRLRGHVRPPVSGSYTFWIAADGDGELWLSADETPGKKTMIASTKGTAFRQWNRYPTQKSAAIELEAGRMYYVEALQKEGGSDDNLSVAWEGPGIQCEVIPGAHLLLP